MDQIAEIEEYFEKIRSGQYSGRYQNEVHLLGRTEALDYSGELGWHPTIALLGGIVLDNPDTSNHHVYAKTSPLAGQIFYFDHDGDSRIVFDSLMKFVDAAEQAMSDGVFLCELHPDVSPICNDQRGLANLIQALCNDAESEDIAVQLIPSLDLLDTELLTRLAAAKNFFLAEAVAIEIRKRPRPDLLHLAEQCRAHPHPQVAEAGIAAIRAIRAG